MLILTDFLPIVQSTTSFDYLIITIIQIQYFYFLSTDHIWIDLLHYKYLYTSNVKYYLKETNISYGF